VVNERVLAPATDDRLFELWIGFRLVDELKRAGFVEQRRHLIDGGRRPLAQMTRSTEKMTLWWQRSIWGRGLFDPQASRFGAVLKNAGMSVWPLRPDFLLVGENPTRVLIVEVKQTAREGVTPDRRGIAEALAYLDDAAEIMKPLPLPHAMVVAWNSTGMPASGRVVVSDQQSVTSALATILDSWATTASGVQFVENGT
jgi:hypothetical protein